MSDCVATAFFITIPIKLVRVPRHGVCLDLTVAILQGWEGTQHELKVVI